MDIQDYLSDKQERLARSSGRIRDFGVFDFNYIPKKPLMREEVKPLIDAILRYEQTGIANHALILGARGSGKSVLARYLMQIMSAPEKINFVYANCRQHNTSFKILASLLGDAAVEALLEGETNVMVGRVGGELVRTPLRETYERKKPIEETLVRLRQILTV